MANNKQPVLTVPKVHYVLPYYIVQCLVHSVGSAVVDFLLEPDDD